VFSEIKPNIVYLPFSGDVHSDHRVVFDAAASCTKWFRSPWIKRVLVYETLSETDMSLPLDSNRFAPNVYEDVSAFLKKKIYIMNIYKSEVGDFPFPRSDESMSALAKLRGSQSGFNAAEGFMLLKEILN
jgi:LmbE family N-acetylglucosaminyl deacetylase